MISLKDFRETIQNKQKTLEDLIVSYNRQVDEIATIKEFVLFNVKYDDSANESFYYLSPNLNIPKLLLENKVGNTFYFDYYVDVNWSDKVDLLEKFFENLTEGQDYYIRL